MTLKNNIVSYFSDFMLHKPTKVGVHSEFQHENMTFLLVLGLINQFNTVENEIYTWLCWDKYEEF